MGKSANVELQIAFSNGSATVKCHYVNGFLALHKNLDLNGPKKGWVITQIETGRRALEVRTKKEGINSINFLTANDNWHIAGATFGKTGPDEERIFALSKIMQDSLACC